MLDSPADPKDYILAHRPRAGALRGHPPLPPTSLRILWEEGRRIVARASEDEAEALAVSGFKIVRLPRTPVVFRARPRALAAAPLAIVPDPAVQDMMNAATSAKAQAYDGSLSGAWPVTIGGAAYTIATRHTRSGTPIEQATQYVYELMQGLGLQTAYHNWTRGTVSGRNVSGTKTGTTLPGEVVLLTAHIDDLPSGATAPGADDNASGCAAVLMAAEILSRHSFQRTVRFVFFTGEEQGLYGSEAYASAAYAAGENIVAVLNLDMIAWDSAGGPVVNLYLRPTADPGSASDLRIAETLTGVIAAYGLSAKLTPKLIKDGMDASDHSSFWNKGYPAILLIEDDWDDFNPWYHTVNDLLAKLDLEYFADVAKASVGTIAHLASLVQVAETRITLSKSSLAFGAIVGGPATPGQGVVIGSSDGGALDWTASSNRSWLAAAPASGSGPGKVTVSVDATGLGAGSYTGTVTVSESGGAGAPAGISVTLTVAGGGGQSPFGSFDLPESGSTVRSSIAVTGWALDDIEVTGVKIYRNPVSGEAAPPGGLVFIGDAVFVEGARPDVELAYPTYPLRFRAGWGYMLLTNFLPNGGNGTYTLHAYATDKEGHEVLVGSKTIFCDNLHAVKPFGAIDLPAQGASISGSAYINGGWALTPRPNSIPTDGSTLMLWVDGLPVGRPSYNHYRNDIATLFPGYANSTGAIGVYTLDTTAFTNGVHTIEWSVRDNAGNEDGIGSRYFSILNTGTSSPQSGLPVRGSLTALAEIQGYRDVSEQPIHARRGYDRSRPPDRILVAPGAHASNSRGVIPAPAGNPSFSQKPLLVVPELERLEILLDERAWAMDAERILAERAGLRPAQASTGRLAHRWEGYLIVGEELRPLPLGSTLDAAGGVFSWLPGPSFLGDYQLVFVDRESMSRTSLTVRIGPHRIH